MTLPKRTFIGLIHERGNAPQGVVVGLQNYLQVEFARTTFLRPGFPHRFSGMAAELSVTALAARGVSS